MNNNLISRQTAIDALLKQPELTPSVVRRVLTQLPAKPLLCEHLGVEVNERFRIEDRSFVYYINEQGVVMVQSIAGLDDHESRDALYAVIYNPERVQRMSKQRLDDIIRQIGNSMQQSGKPMTEADKQRIRDNAQTPEQVEAAIRELESKHSRYER